MAELGLVPEVELCTSEYAAEEARRNLPGPEQQARLDHLLASMSLVTGSVPVPEGVELAAKDRPILQGAIYAHATHLITGDKKDFGHLFGQTVGGVLIQWLREYGRRREAGK